MPSNPNIWRLPRDNGNEGTYVHIVYQYLNVYHSKRTYICGVAGILLLCSVMQARSALKLREGSNLADMTAEQFAYFYSKRCSRELAQPSSCRSCLLARLLACMHRGSDLWHENCIFSWSFTCLDGAIRAPLPRAVGHHFMSHYETQTFQSPNPAPCCVCVCTLSFAVSIIPGIINVSTTKMEGLAHTKRSTASLQLLAHISAGISQDFLS